MSDKEIGVKFSADVKDLLSGMKDAQESISTATEGMKGDLGSIIESFEKFGLAAVGIGAAGLAFEGLKEGISIASEAIEKTNSMARTFEGLSYQTGESYQHLNVLNTAMAMTGGTVEELSGWMKGATRAMSQHADMLVANGIAASESALRSMPFTEYLKKVMEKAEQIQEPFRRSQFLTESLGRAGMEAAPQIRRMLETLGEAGAVFEQYGNGIDEGAIKRMQEMEKEMGKVRIASEAVSKDIAAQASDLAMGWTKAKLGFLSLVDAIIGGKKTLAQAMEGTNGPKNTEDTWTSRGFRKTDKHGVATPDSNQGDTGETLFQQTEIGWKKVTELQKIYAEGEAALLVAEKNRTKEQEKAVSLMARLQPEAASSVPAGPSAKGPKVAGAVSAEAAPTSGGGGGVSLQADVDAANAAAAAEAQVQKVLQKQRDKDAQDAMTRAEQDDQKGMDAREKSANELIKFFSQQAKEQDAIAKATTEAQISDAHVLLAAQKADLDKKVAMGDISVGDEIKARKDLINTETALEVARINDQIKRWQQEGTAHIAEEIKAEAEIRKIKAKGAEESKKLDEQNGLVFKRMADSMTSGWDNDIQKMANSQESLGRGFKKMAQEMGDSMEKVFIKMGLDYLKYEALKIAGAKEAHMSQNLMSAKDAAAAAWSSAADIPVVGWILGPIAAAAAFAGVMAFAEGGWDNVPNDQVAMIHKQEMVLPANLAEGARQTFAAAASGSGGGGGGGPIHIHAMDAHSVDRFLAKNGGKLAKAMSVAIRNGRYT